MGNCHSPVEWELSSKARIRLVYYTTVLAGTQMAQPLKGPEPMGKSPQLGGQGKYT